MGVKQLLFIPIIGIIIVSILGLITLYSTIPVGNAFTIDFDNVVLKQILFLLISWTVLYLLIKNEIVVIQSIYTSGIIWLSLVILLTILLIFGSNINQTSRWFQFGPFLVQPSEFVKIILPLIISSIVCCNLKKEVKYISIAIAVLIPSILIFLQPDAGTVITILIVTIVQILYLATNSVLGRKMIVFILLLISLLLLFLLNAFTILLTIPLLLYFVFRNREFIKHFLIIGIALSVVVLSTVLAWNSGVIKDYQKERVLSFVGTTEISDQIKQSRIAIGSGGLWGKGIGQGTQTRLRYLPEYTTDFAFAAFVEEWGFAGVFVLLILYILILTGFLLELLEVQDDFIKVASIGLLTKLSFEIILNIGMNMGLLPTKGVALPFFSYGGTSVLSNYVIAGIITSLLLHYKKRDKIITIDDLPMLV